MAGCVKGKKVKRPGKNTPNNSPPAKSHLDDACSDDGQIPWLYWLLSWIIYVLLFFIFHHISKALPPPASQRNYNNIYQFRETKARQHLTNFTSHGPHFVGSLQNEYYIPVFLTEALKSIEDRSRGVNHVVVDSERASGSYFASYGGGFAVVYDTVNSVVVKFGPHNDTTPSVLVTCNYDSTPRSAGSAYNAASCSCLLEILDVLSRVDKPFSRNIIFLFSGADELVLQAKHAFMTQHKWASSVRAFVNLESCGAGGEEVLVASGLKHPWLVKIYSKVSPYSFSSLLFSELISKGIQPVHETHKMLSQTDSLDIPGIQIAHAGLGELAHTQDDLMRYIPLGGLQKCGESVMQLLRGLVKSPFLDFKRTYSESINRTYLRGTQVTINILGVYQLSVPGRWARLAGITMSVIAVIHVAFHMFLYYCEGDSKTLNVVFVGYLATGACWCITTALVVIIGTCVDFFGFSLSWYSSVWMLAGLYVTSSLTCIFSIHGYFKKFILVGKDPWLLERTFYDIHLALFALIILLLVWVKSQLMIYFVIWEFCAFTTRLLLDYFVNTPDNHPVFWGTVYFVHVCICPASIFLFTIYVSASYIWRVLPESGSEVVPDVIMALVCSTCTLVCASFQVGHIYLTDKALALARILAMFFAGAVVISMFSHVGFPYSGDPTFINKQRHRLQHISRVMHSASGSIIRQDSGILHTPLDRNGVIRLRPFVPELSKQRPVRCEKGPYCGWPFIQPTWDTQRKMYYIPAERPHVRTSYSPVFTLYRQEILPHGQRLHFNVSGSSHMNIYISPRPHAHLTSWSIKPTKPKASSIYTADGRSHYFIYYAYGLRPKDTWKFWIELKVPAQSFPNEPIVDIAFACHYFSVNGESVITGDLHRYMTSFPKWATATPWVSLYQSFIY